MFNLFNKKEDPKVYGTTLAKQANLEPIHQKGKICGFSISFEGDETIIFNKLKQSETKIAFIIAIDNRILKNEYRDDIPAILENAGLDTPEEYFDFSVKRIVCSKNYDLIFSWE